VALLRKRKKHKVMTMAKFSMFSLKPAPGDLTAARRGRWFGAALVMALVLAGCAVEFQNRQASQEVAQLAKPPGSVYMGWRVFQDKCASCHGPAATGSSNAPDHLPKVRDLGARQFLSLVLQRYDLNQPASAVRSDGAAKDAQVEVIMQRKDAPLSMPAWQGEPRVNAHIADLYAYLSARAQGTQGPERPAP
jgi:cytochrome c553